jgi:hypothetical protein
MNHDLVIQLQNEYIDAATSNSLMNNAKEISVEERR